MDAIENISVQLTRIADAIEARLFPPHTPLSFLSSLNSLNSEVKKEQESDGLGVQREGKPTAKRPSRARAPRTTYPTGFEFDDRAKQLAEALGLNPYKQLASFKDKSLANGYIYSDWQAAFRNWLRAANDFKGGGR
jgi:hypothetical protein